MYCKLYLDSFFLQQVILNLYMLALVKKIMKCTATHFRIFLGAITGALITCACMLIPLDTLYGRLLIGVVPSEICMLWIAFRTVGKTLGKACLIAGGCSFFIGSIIMWILSRFRQNMNTGEELLLMLAGGYGAYRILERLWRWMEKRQKKEQFLVSIPCSKQETPVRVRAFVDTGNRLVDPVSGKPVCLISDREAARIAENFRPEKYHIIPYQSVGKSRGMLDAYELPVLYLEDSVNRWECRQVIVAICNTGIAKEDSCQMILHPGVLEE